jgi:hypothetical protein
MILHIAYCFIEDYVKKKEKGGKKFTTRALQEAIETGIRKNNIIVIDIVFSELKVQIHALIHSKSSF